jgi:hypothetical protein
MPTFRPGACDPSSGDRRNLCLPWPSPGPCENFLYGFKAARRAARAADSVRSPTLPLPLPLRRRQRRSPGAKSMKLGAAIDIQTVIGISSVRVERPCSRCRDCPGPVRTRQGRL